MGASIHPNNFIPMTIPKEQFLRAWVTFMRPFHHLTPRDEDVATAFLVKWFELCESIPNDKKLRTEILMGEDTQRKIREMCGLKAPHLNVSKSKLKKNGFLVEDGINPRLIPNFKKEEDDFQLLLVFKFPKETNQDVNKETE